MSLYFSLKRIVHVKKPDSVLMNLKDYQIKERILNGHWKQNISGVWELDKQLGLVFDGNVRTFYTDYAKEAGCGYNYSHLIRDWDSLLLGHLITVHPQFKTTSSTIIIHQQ